MNKSILNIRNSQKQKQKQKQKLWQPYILEEMKDNFIIFANTKQSRVKIQKILSAWIDNVLLNPALGYINTHHLIKYL